MKAGATLLILLGAVALLAPCLAGDLPLLVVSSSGLQTPAVRAMARILPASEPRPPVAAGWTLRPPVPHDPLAIDLGARLAPPGAAHWLGTDELGRDVLSRAIHATRPSLIVALLATAVSLALGVPVGAVAGYGGGRTDLLLSRLIEASLSFPALVLLLLITSMTIGATVGPGTGRGAVVSLVAVGGAVGIVRWGVIARYMRGEVKRLASGDLALAARASGAGTLRLLGRHLVPAGLAPVVVSAAFGAGSAVIAEASLSFLGLGVQPPAPTLGQMIASAATYGTRHWWLLVFPGAVVAMIVAGFNLLGEGLRRRVG